MLQAFVAKLFAVTVLSTLTALNPLMLHQQNAKLMLHKIHSREQLDR